MKETAVVAATEIPALGITFVQELPQQKQLHFQTHISSLSEKEEIDKLVDKIVAVAERQFWIQRIEPLTKELLNNKRIAEDHVRNIGIAEENAARAWERRGRKGPFKLSEPEEVEKAKAHNHTRVHKEIIERNKKDLLEAYEKAGREPPADLK